MYGIVKVLTLHNQLHSALTLDVNHWVLMGAVNVFLLIAGFFLPPVAVILMAAPILLPIITAAGFDPIWLRGFIWVTARLFTRFLPTPILRTKTRPNQVELRSTIFMI